MSPRCRARRFLLVLAACAACDLPLLSPPSDERQSLRLQVLEQEDTSVVRVLGLVDRARLEISGSGFALDTVVPATPLGGTVVVRFVLSAPLPRGALTVRVELSAGARVLMAGGGTLQREGSDRILLRPVADRLLAEPPPADIDVLGQTLPLGGEVLFATGDVWLGARPIWLSDNPGVLEVQPGDVAISRSNGTARLRLSFEDLSREWVVRVAQRPVELWGVAPADTTVTVGASFPLRVFGQDRNGFALVPGARVAWLVGGGILVDSLGVLTATQAGPAFASVVLGNTQHTAVLTIVPAGS
jgi:hypothetical protein